MSDLMSRPYEPKPDRCCEACVFGAPGPHRDFCAKRPAADAPPPAEPYPSRLGLRALVSSLKSIEAERIEHSDPEQGETVTIRRGAYSSYLDPRDGPVIDGLERHEVVYAKNQPQYRPLRTLRSPEGRVISRWTLNHQQRLAVASGADIFLELFTFNQPLQPVLMSVGQNLDPEYFRVTFQLPRDAHRDEV